MCSTSQLIALYETEVTYSQTTQMSSWFLNFVVIWRQKNRLCCHCVKFWLPKSSYLLNILFYLTIDECTKPDLYGNQWKKLLFLYCFWKVSQIHPVCVIWQLMIIAAHRNQRYLSNVDRSTTWMDLFSIWPRTQRKWFW